MAVKGGVRTGCPPISLAAASPVRGVLEGAAGPCPLLSTGGLPCACPLILPRSFPVFCPSFRTGDLPCACPAKLPRSFPDFCSLFRTEAPAGFCVPLLTRGLPVFCPPFRTEAPAGFCVPLLTRGPPVFCPPFRTEVPAGFRVPLLSEVLTGPAVPAPLLWTGPGPGARTAAEAAGRGRTAAEPVYISGI